MAVLTGRSNVLKSRISDVSPRTATVSRATGDVGEPGGVGGDELGFPRLLLAAGRARAVGEQLDVALQLWVRSAKRRRSGRAARSNATISRLAWIGYSVWWTSVAP